jgi:CheY-like chemotaxis protein
MPNAILDPTGAVTSSAAQPAAPRAPRLASLQGKRVGLLINTKQNAGPFLEEVGRLLADRYDVTLTQRTKLNFAMPEPENVIKELAAEADVIITGVGDCGSCSAAAAADGVVLEAAGVPVAAIITDSFIPTADAMAALRGAPGYQYATTAHPVAVLTADKVRERAAQVLDDVVALLVEPGKAEA